jgi:hypothetical protein
MTDNYKFYADHLRSIISRANDALTHLGNADGAEFTYAIEDLETDVENLLDAYKREMAQQQKAPMVLGAAPDFREDQ